MQKRKLALIIAATLTTTVASDFAFKLTNKNSLSGFANAPSSNYVMSMSSSENKLFSETGSTSYSGDTNLKTSLDNDINFVYSETMGLNNTWHVFKDGGYFYNSDPLNGIQNIEISFKTNDKSFKVYWSYDGNFSETNSHSVTSSSTDAFTFSFNSKLPAYVKFVNTSGANLNIASIDIEYSCAQPLFTVVATSNDETMGTVTGGGSYIYGTSVTLTATANAGYDFRGWTYNGSSIFSTNPTYTFTVLDQDYSFTAYFAVAYKINISSEDESKGSVSGPSESCAGKSITISAIPALGYSFNFWYDDDLNVISESENYTFVMPEHDVTLYAGFNNGLKVEVFTRNDDEVSVSGGGIYQMDSTATVTASLINNRGTFVGWYEGDACVSTSLSYTFTCTNNRKLEARWHNLVIYNGSVTGYNTASKYVYVPENVFALSSRAFINNTTIEEISLPDGLEVINHTCFSGCTSLKYIDVPYNVTSIGSNAFYDCSSLEYVNMWDNIVSIDYQAFCGCLSLTSIYLPRSLASISLGLIRDCRRLTSVSFGGTMATWNSLSKGENWHLNIPATSVRCSDGFVSI